MTKELVGCSSDYAIAEMLLSGITSFCDMYYFEDEIAKSCEKMSVRALLGETIIDMPTCDSPEPSGGLLRGNLYSQVARPSVDYAYACATCTEYQFTRSVGENY